MTAPEWEQAWLAAAAGGGLPEPTRTRWQPTRVGIVSLWEYDNAEFWFADGRLVLRGGNGAGKTKVLELTTLMLLRGEITPSVLDPFGSQHRTMRFNLLPTGEGDDPREPVEAGLGYAWVEFGRRDETGQPHFMVCGLGASARRGTGAGSPKPWCFVTALRPGKDLFLLADGRALDQKDLSKVDGVWVAPSAAAYRSRLAADLFGVAADSYDNITDLLKQLRKPKLGERLNPTTLAQTLREALPPIAGHEITQLAEGWQRLEQLRTAVEETEAAAAAVARFTGSRWVPWARAVLRRRADELTSATTTLDRTTRDKNEATGVLEGSQTEAKAADDELVAARREQQDRGTELRELLDDAAFRVAAQAASRVSALRDKVRTLSGHRDAAQNRLLAAERAVTTADRAAATARDHVTDAADGRDRIAAELARAAEPAGLASSVRRWLSTHDVAGLTADHAVRAERFTHLRHLHTEHAEAAKRAERSGGLLEQLRGQLSAVRAEEAAALSTVRLRVEAAEQAVRTWADSADVVPVDAGEVAGWCDLVADATVIDEETGQPRPGPTFLDAMRRRVATVRTERQREREELLGLLSPLRTRRETLQDGLDALLARPETAPPEPPTWRRRDRPALDVGQGAPLWRLVNPAPSLTPDQTAMVEAALAASGLLDAWVTPDGVVSRVDGELVADVSLAAAPEAAGRSLAAVLRPDPAGGVPVEVTRRLLAGIGCLDHGRDEPRYDWVALDGGFRIGGLTGRAEPAGPASFLGAAARAAARQRELDRLRAELADVTAEIAELDRWLSDVAAALSALDTAEETLPTAAERELLEAVATFAERQRRTRAVAADHDRQQRVHHADVERRDRAWAGFAEYAGEHGFRLDDLDAQHAALHGYHQLLTRLDGAVATWRARQEGLEAAEELLHQRAEEREGAAEELAAADSQLRQATVQLTTAEAGLSQDHRAKLRRREELDAALAALGARIEGLGERKNRADVALARARLVLDQHEERRAEAEQKRDAALDVLGAVVTAGLGAALDMAAPPRWSVAGGREFATAVRRHAGVAVSASDAERAWRRCLAGVEELRQQLLPDRDVRVEDDEGAAVPAVVVLVDPTQGFQPPRAAADALAEQVRRQRDSYDEEQQRVLTTLLGSTFIEHLKERLDYTAHTFARINDHLQRHPTRHGQMVRVDWSADPGDPDAGAVVAALGRGYHELSGERQEMVRAFLARRIDDARNDTGADGSDWTENLAKALDYRSWLRIGLQYRAGAGSRWTPFDSARHAAKSGGEKVVLLSQPLFAAAVVAFDAAGQHAPRWVWLDEAMTGVDAAIKASFMGLTVDFELDVMLTAHDEWCNYATVPAVAIHDLARNAHLPGVDVQVYLWCGGSMTTVDTNRPAAATDTLSTGLFGPLDDG